MVMKIIPANCIVMVHIQQTRAMAPQKDSAAAGETDLIAQNFDILCIMTQSDPVSARMHDSVTCKSTIMGALQKQGSIRVFPLPFKFCVLILFLLAEILDQRTDTLNILGIPYRK